MGYRRTVVRYLIFAAAAGAILYGGIILFGAMSTPAESPSSVPTFPVNSFEECVTAGFPVMESYPAQCRTPDGRMFVQDIGNELEKTDLIRITYPRPNQAVATPLRIEGEARGTWFFEASFPVRILDVKGEVLGEHYAQAEGEWMTEEFVPFSAILEFGVPITRRGTLVLERDNPSGLPENSDALYVPVIFSGVEP